MEKNLKFVFAAVFGAVFEVNGQKICATIINRIGCDPAECRALCIAENKEGQGFCGSNSVDGTLVCNCVYYCASL